MYRKKLFKMLSFATYSKIMEIGAAGRFLYISLPSFFIRYSIFHLKNRPGTKE